MLPQLLLVVTTGTAQAPEIYESFRVKNVVLFTVKVRAKNASVGDISLQTKDKR